MKSIYDMSGIEKVAALFVAIGPEAAADICKYLDQDSVIRISREIAKIEKLDPEDKEDLIGEFIIQLKKVKQTSQGGEDMAKKVLMEAFGIEKAKDIFNKVNEKHVDEHFEFLKEIEADLIVTLLEQEHMQTIAVVMTYLGANKAGQVMKLLPRQTAKDVALRIAKMGKIAPEAVYEMSKALKRKYDAIRNEHQNEQQPGGLHRLADIMHHMNGDVENRILQHFDRELPVHAQEIRDRIYSFEHITSLTNKEVRILIDELGDDRLVALSLKGAGDEMRFKFLRNMSNNRATDIIDEMDRMGAVRVSEIQEARQDIVKVMRALNDNGSIIIKKAGEEYVE